jgi:hypothetical protein
MTIGARHFGDNGRRLGDAEAVLLSLFPELDSDVRSFLPPNSSISKFSSSIGLELHDIKFSPYMSCLQLLPGALFDLSWRAGRPGIVAR